MNEKKKILISILLYILSGIMLTISMPPFFNIPFIGFVALAFSFIFWFSLYFSFI